MSEMCYAVKCFKNHLRYTYSQILADKWAKQYKSEVYIAFDVPNCLIEPLNTNYPTRTNSDYPVHLKQIG